MTDMVDMNDNDLIDAMYKKRSEKEIAAKTVKELNDEFKAMEAELINRLANTGMKTAGTTLAKVSLSEEVVPQVEDWEKVHRYVKDKDAWHLLKRSLNAAPFREMLQADEELPGVVPFTRRKLSLTKA